MNEIRFFAETIADALNAVVDALENFGSEETSEHVCDKKKCCCHKPTFDFDDDDELDDLNDDFDFRSFARHFGEKKETRKPLRPWKVAEVEPKEDPNKVFGIRIQVDEPRREDYDSRWEFERDHKKFDNLVDAAEACDWENKSNTAPLHKVGCIKKRLEDGPPTYFNIIGETHWF